MRAAVPDWADIDDYALIGNCHTAALVSRYGSIDWWCPYRFDAASVFAAILDPDVGGRWWVGPTVPFTSTRRYLPRTNVLETTFRTDHGSARLIDLMPMRAGAGGIADGLEPRFAILRVLEGVEGEVPIGMVFEPRWAYGSSRATLVARREVGVVCERPGEAMALRAELPLVLEEGRAVGGAMVRAGDRRALSLSFAEREPLVLPAIGRVAGLVVDETVQWWHQWMGCFRYEGPHREAVERSALVLKLLCYAPSGAVVAAPTMGLPEDVGGVRNWDYRYCWLRDASMTLRALVDLGFDDEAGAFLNWLLTATQLTAPRLEVMYDLFGNGCLAERELGWLRGYRDSRPVRVGNAAASQLQLDLYGEVVGAALAHVRRGGELGRWQQRLLVGLGRHASVAWREPDSGIWEPRGVVRHHTHSKVNCWRALDGLIELGVGGHLGRAPVEDFRRTAAVIREVVEARGFDEASGSYTSWLDGDQVDASLLLLGLQGFVPPDHPRMTGTWDRLERELARDGLWHRYGPGWVDGVAGKEAAFGICSFWAVEYLARAGRREEAEGAFRSLMACANEVGLFGEQIDPRGRALGNFPQGFTHVGLISAALALAGTPPGPAERP